MDVEVDIQQEAQVIFQKAMEVLEECKKLETKENKSAGIRARAGLDSIHKMIIPLRKGILTKMKSLPVKRKNK